jgi:hypothetical protein
MPYKHVLENLNPFKDLTKKDLAELDREIEKFLKDNPGSSELELILVSTGNGAKIWFQLNDHLKLSGQRSETFPVIYPEEVFTHAITLSRHHPSANISVHVGFFSKFADK